METVFKVGDRIFHYTYGWGIVKGLLSDDEWIKVFFEKDQREHAFIGYDYFSFTEYDLVNGGFSQVRPKKEPEIGSLCLFSDDEERFNNNIGLIDILDFIDIEDDTYKSKTRGWFKFCKQIEIKEV